MQSTRRDMTAECMMEVFGALVKVTEKPFLPTAASGDSLDWKDISADEIYQRVTSRVEPGSIILFHNAGLNTPEALPEVLEYLLSEGYEVVPVSEILLEGEYTVDHEGRQWAAE